MDRDIREINSEFIRLNEAELLTPQAKRKEKGDYTVRYGITKDACFKEIDATKSLKLGVGKFASQQLNGFLKDKCSGTA